MKDLGAIFIAMIDYLSMAKECFLLRDEKIANECVEKRKYITGIIRSANKEHIARLRDGTCQPMSAHYFTNFLGIMRRIRSHVTNIVEASMGEK